MNPAELTALVGAAALLLTAVGGFLAVQRAGRAARLGAAEAAQAVIDKEKQNEREARQKERETELGAWGNVHQAGQEDNRILRAQLREVEHAADRMIKKLEEECGRKIKSLQDEIMWQAEVHGAKLKSLHEEIAALRSRQDHQAP